MLKRLKNLTVLILTVVMMMGNVIDVCAKEPDATKMKLVNEYTENGTHIVVYEIVSDISEMMPRFPVYKSMSMWVEFNGWVTPPSTHSYKIDYDPDYKTSMSGTLYLKSSEKKFDASGNKITIAFYEGTIAGNI